MRNFTEILGHVYERIQHKSSSIIDRQEINIDAFSRIGTKDIIPLRHYTFEKSLLTREHKNCEVKFSSYV